MLWTTSFNLKNPTRDLVRVGDRLLPRTFELRLEEAAPWPDARCRFDLVDGAFQCRQVTVTAAEGGPEVKTFHLREIHIEDLLESAAATVGLVIRSDGADGLTIATPVRTEDEARGTVHQVRAARKSARRQVTGDLLREVAEVYRANLADRPTEAVALHFGKSHRTASLYIKLARDAGFLGKAVPGKAGER